tara:strand:- start:6295 stop:6930 length:636 start_codon:yes stop_codon:yes gene_type:complete
VEEFTMRPATDVFSEWADIGKDAGMETGHAPAVQEILRAAIPELQGFENFRAIDAGCGNGWVVRMLGSTENCSEAIGIDGAHSMIQRAKEIDPQGTYVHANLETWSPEVPVEFVHSMEVLYYLNDIPSFLNRVHQKWLCSRGVFAFGIDHYLENEDCHGWAEKVGTKMAMHSEFEWKKMVEESGFEILRTFRAAASEEWVGTFVMICRKCG